MPKILLGFFHGVINVIERCARHVTRVSMHCDDVNPEITGQWDIFECMMCNQTCLFSARVITLYHSKQKKQSKLASFFMQRITHFSKPTKEKKKMFCKRIPD